jgi:acetylornithine deacetylase/succinyl-diaminopimelate desuccinylase-like protein
MLSDALGHARAHRERYLAQLIEFLRIPSISTLSEHKPDIERAARWLAADMWRAGLERVQVMPTAGNPVVYGEWLRAGEGAPTILIYGHYDVQPVDPISLWDSPPFEAQIRGGLIYARGASDNKAQMFSHVKAIESMLSSGGALPINVKLCFDGEEEVGSPNLEPFVRAHAELLAADAVVISDGPMIGEGQPSIDYALRGIVTVEMRVTGPRRDLHSGSYGGSVHNPAQVVAEIVAALHDKDGRVTVPGFYDRVTPLSEEERELLSRVPYTKEQWQAETGVEVPWGEPEYTLFERMTARPTLEVNGMWGGFTGEGFKTIIPREAGAKISMRLVAAQDPQEIAQFFADYVKYLASPTVQIDVTTTAGAAAAVTPYNSRWIRAAARAYQAVWGIPAVLGRGGGSLPIVATFQKELNAPFVLMPFGLDDNRHSPNEHYSIDYFYRGIDTAVHYQHFLLEEGWEA